MVEVVEIQRWVSLVLSTSDTTTDATKLVKLLSEARLHARGVEWSLLVGQPERRSL